VIRWLELQLFLSILAEEIQTDLKNSQKQN